MTILESIETYMNEIENNTDKKTLQKLDPNLTKRVAKRLDDYSETCETCAESLISLEKEIVSLKSRELTKEVIQEHQKVRAVTIAHLGKEHKIIQDGHYMAIYMSLGMSLGVVFGLTIFDNIALGIPIGDWNRAWDSHGC